MRADVAAFLGTHRNAYTLPHLEAVASEAARLAQRFEVDPDKAEKAALIHDISVVIPAGERLDQAREWGLEILPEEAAYPLLLHQRLSAVLAKEVLGVMDEEVLSAAACHTTLRPHSSRLDRVVFIADKLAWDQPGLPPYLEGLRVAIECSLERGAWFYLEYLRSNASGPLHPWARLAWLELIPSGHFPD